MILKSNKRGVLGLLLILFLFLFLIYPLNSLKHPSAVNKKISNSQAAKVKGVNIQPTPRNLLSGKGVYFGMWTQGFFDPSSQSLHSDALIKFENKIGKKAAIAHYYRGWNSLDSAVFLTELKTISANGWRPMISANPYFFDRCKANGLTLYKAIANGNCDEFLHSVARNFKQFFEPVFFRFAWEMNVSSMEWAVLKTGDNNSDFVAGWQRIHEIFYQEGATNVLFVFCPNVGGQINYQDIYPGDSFVDWIALDGYNWGTTQSWSRWESFQTVFASSYNQILDAAPNKPLMLSEVNTTDVGGDKPSWYKDMLTYQIPNNFPKIKAIVMYNEDRTLKENVNWLIDINKKSLSAFKIGIKNSIYLSSF